MDHEKLIDVETAAQALGVHPATLYRWARARRVPCIRLGPRVIRFDPRGLEQFLRSSTVEARGA